MRKGPSTEPVRTRNCRMVTSKAGGRSTRRTSPGGSARRARRHLGIEEQSVAACPACGAAGANTRRARLCHRTGAQIIIRLPLVYSTSRLLERISVRHQVEIRTPLNADRDVRMAIVVETRRHRVSDTKVYPSMSPTRSPKRGFTCLAEVLTKERSADAFYDGSSTFPLKWFLNGGVS